MNKYSIIYGSMRDISVPRQRHCMQYRVPASVHSCIPMHILKAGFHLSLSQIFWKEISDTPVKNTSNQTELKS